MTQTQCAQIEMTNIVQDFTLGKETIHVIKKCSVSFEPCSFNIVFGPSGSGKSTLLNALSGIQKPSQGTVTYGGRDLYSMSRRELAYFRATQIGIVYQQNYWIGSLNAVENVSMSLLFSGEHRSSAKKKALEALDKVGIGHLANKNPQYLSGGEQQRVAIARAIITNPGYIVADEPTGSLDMKRGDQIMAMLKDYQQTQSSTVILVTHNLEYLPLGEQLINVQDGVVSQLGGEALKTAATIKGSYESIIADMRRRMNSLSENKQS